jgi:integrase
MATIVKKQRKNGYAFLFQVKVRNPATGQQIAKTKSWNPPKEYSAKQAEREATIRADEFEREIRATYNKFNPNGALTPDSTFKDCATAFLKRLERQCNLEVPEASFTHLATGERNLEYACKYLGHFKLRSLTSAIIQNFFDFLDGRKRTIRTVRSKPEVLRQVCKEKGESYKTFVYTHGLNSNTICYVLNAKRNVDLSYAEKVAKILGVDINLIFDIQVTEVPYANRTNHHIKAYTRAVLSYATRMQLIDRNYARAEYVEYTSVKQKEIQCMDENQVMRILRTLIDYTEIHHSTAMLTLIFTGLRRGEVNALKWENISLDDNMITVARSISYTNEYGYKIKDPKTAKSKRTIEIPDILAQQLRRYKEWYFDTKEQMGDAWAGNKNYVFVNIDTGTRIHIGAFLHWINKITKTAGLGHWTVHSLRHTNITMKLRNNVPLLEASADAGHSRPSTTTDRYGHFLKTEKRKAPGVMDNIFMLPLAK